MNKVGEFFALCREIKGLSLREVEVMTGISNATISQIETGKHGVTLVNAVKLCDAYGVSDTLTAAVVRGTR
jgi:transcriptional regulator with XRE-family HTH domain